MAIRKSLTEDVYVVGSREEIRAKIYKALELAGFVNIQKLDLIEQISAKYHRFPYWGTIEITLLESSDDRIHVRIFISANIDNIYALFVSPGKKISEKFKIAFCAL